MKILGLLLLAVFVRSRKFNYYIYITMCKCLAYCEVVVNNLEIQIL